MDPDPEEILQLPACLKEQGSQTVLHPPLL